MLPGSTYSKFWCPNTICCAAAGAPHTAVSSAQGASQSWQRQLPRTVVGQQAQQRGKEEAADGVAGHDDPAVGQDGAQRRRFLPASPAPQRLG